MMNRLIFLCIILFLSVNTLNAQPKYEFRGVWVATVNNIDWPTAGNWDTEKQKAEYIHLLDMHHLQKI